ncbi:hypothetical protein AKJ16_DCAP04379 [Drosera capensis]
MAKVSARDSVVVKSTMSSLSAAAAGGTRLQYPHLRRDESVVGTTTTASSSRIRIDGLRIRIQKRRKEFVEKQVKLTESVLAQCETMEKSKKNLTELFDYPRYDPPFWRFNK